MALPADADVVVVRGFWWDEVTGQGVKSGNGSSAVITFDPVPVLGASGSGTPNVRDITTPGHIKTRRRSATVDPVTGYFCTLLLSNNDPDLDAYGGRKVTFPGERPFIIEVPHNAPKVPVDAAMARATGLTQGSQVRAIWLTDASLLENPAPGAPSGYMTSAQVLAAINSGVVSAVAAHDIDPDAHTDLREMITESVVGASTALATHILDPSPHPEYDDLPSLTLLFRNGLV